MNFTNLIVGDFSTADRDLWLDVTTQAACSSGGLGPDEWYPISVPAATARREAAAAIAVCSDCPVRARCLELSLQNWEVGQHGVWGGTVPSERAELRRGRVAGVSEVLAARPVAS
jgi:WhiB family redox-sensing transcriptional regulator